MEDQNKIENGKFSSTTSYDRTVLKSNIVHIGFGAFHRGHQAVYNDLTNDQSEDKWGICEINMFGGSELTDSLRAQDHLLTVVEKSATETHSRLVRTITESIHTPVDGIEKAILKLTEDQVKIVSLTITEKGYCAAPQSGMLDETNQLIIHDLANPTVPMSAIGLVTAALRIRRDNGLAPFSVLSCDNIPENGHLTKSVILAFAKKLDTELSDWIEENVTFPSTMVDRIVPAMTDDQFDVIEEQTGYRDPCGIVCEDFRQWVVEDNFVAGRPQWEKAGAMLVGDVLPYEEMKLRMLNGSHSFLAYNGSLAGYEFIYQCMQDSDFRTATLKLMLDEQAKSLSPDLNVDLNEYANLLIARFSNTNIKHKTEQIAMDGSQKLPQRALAPYLTLQERHIPAKCQPVLIAGWMHYVIDMINKNNELADPLVKTYKSIMSHASEKSEQAKSLLAIEKIFGKHGVENKRFIEQVLKAFDDIETMGINITIEKLVKD